MGSVYEKKNLRKKNISCMYVCKNEVSNSLDRFYVLVEQRCNQPKLLILLGKSFASRLRQHGRTRSSNIEKRQHHFFIHLIY